MSEQALSLPRQAATGVSRRVAAGSLVWAVLIGNAVAIVWLWVHGGNLTGRSGGAVLPSIARITGLLAAYLALLQVILLARLPVLERLAGFDRLSVWHRWNGHACIDLVLAHVVFSVWGYALLDKLSLPKEISTMLGGGIYPGMITATIGTALLLAVVVVFRVLVPAAAAARHRLRVAGVVDEGPGVVSLRIEGRRLDRLQARAGQFFIWRFLAPGLWWSAHPFSLSQAPDGRSLRITVKALGDHSSRLAGVPVGTRVVAEGPFGVFTGAVRRRAKVLLIAGGI